MQPCFLLSEGLSLAVHPTLSQLGPRQDTPLFLASALSHAVTSDLSHAVTSDLSHALTSDLGSCTISFLAFGLQPAICSPFHLALSLAVRCLSMHIFTMRKIIVLAVEGWYKH